MKNTTYSGALQVDISGYTDCRKDHRGFTEWQCPECSVVASAAGMKPYSLPEDVANGRGLVVRDGRPHKRQPHSRVFFAMPDGRSTLNPNTGFTDRSTAIVIVDQINFGVRDRKNREIGMRVVKELSFFPEGALWIFDTDHTRDNNLHGRMNLPQSREYYTSEEECDKAIYHKLEASMKKAVNYGTPYGYK